MNDIAAFLGELLMCCQLFIGGRACAVCQPKHVKRYVSVTPLLCVKIRKKVKNIVLSR